MGVQGLWRILQPSEETVRLPHLDGRTIGVDLAIWMCHDMTVKYNSAVTLKLYVRNLFFRVVSLLMHGALPVGVCDGPAPALKLRTMQQRQQKSKNGAKVTTSTKRTHFRRIAKECCSLLELLGVPHLESPGEAESMCAHLNSHGKTDACLTADGDAFLYGAETVYSALSLAKGDSGVSMFRSERIRQQLGLDRSRLVALGLLLGCDFIASAKGVGPKRAMDWLRGLSAEVDLLKVLREAFQPEALDCLAASDRRIVSELLLRLEPNFEEVISEFFANSTWALPSREFSWNRPQPFQLIAFCAKQLDWEESYTLEKVLPLVAAWDLRHPRLCKEPVLRPLKVLRKRQLQFVPSFEVQWAKFGFDNWSSEVHYVFCVPQHPFSIVHSDLVAALERASANKGRKKKDKGDEEKENKVEKQDKKEQKKEKGKNEEKKKEKEEERERRRRLWEEDDLVDDLSERLQAAVFPSSNISTAFRVTAWTPGQAEMNLKLSCVLLTPEGKPTAPCPSVASIKTSSFVSPLADVRIPSLLSPVEDVRIPSFFSPSVEDIRAHSSPSPALDDSMEDSPLPLLQRLARRKRL